MNVVSEKSIPQEPLISLPEKKESISDNWLDNVGKIIKKASEDSLKVNKRTKLNYILEKNLPELSKSQIEKMVHSVAKNLTGKSLSLEQEIYHDLADHLKLEMISDSFPLSLKIEIVKRNIQRNGIPQSKGTIKKYGFDNNTLEGQIGLISIARFVAQQNGRKASEFIQIYGIDKSTPEGQEALIEIAELAAQQNGAGTSEFIKNYGIDRSTEKGQKALIRIAKLAAQDEGGGTAEFIKNYGIDKSRIKDLIEIAKLAARQNGSKTSECIQNFDLGPNSKKGQKALRAIAMIAAQQDGEGVSMHIQKYQINPKTKKGQDALIQIARFAAEQNGEATSKYIQRYGINIKTRKNALVEIAKLAAQQDGKGTSKFIQNYSINAQTAEGQIALIQIAEIAAKQDGLETSKYIKNYDINANTPAEQKVLIRIASLAVRQGGWKVFHNFKFYDSKLQENVDWEQAKTGMMVYAIGTVIEEIQTGKKFDADSEAILLIKKIWAPLGEILSRKDFINDDVSSEIQKLGAKFLEVSVDKLTSSVNNVAKSKIKKEEIQRIQLQQFSFLLKAFGDLLVLNAHDSAMKDVYFPIINAELNLRDPAMRNEVWNFLVSNMNEALFESCRKKFQESNDTHFTILPNIFLAFLEKEGIEYKDIGKSLETLSGGRSKTLLMKDAKFYKLMLQTLIAISNDNTLSPANKKYLIESTLALKVESGRADKINILKALQNIKGIIALDKGILLREEILPKDKGFSQILSEIHEQSFREIVPIKKEMQNFTENFERYFESFRDPSTLFIYASTLKKLPKSDEEIMMKTLALCVEDVVEEQFPVCRYKGSEHLNIIFEKREMLKTNWQKGEKMLFGKFLSELNDTKEEVEKGEGKLVVRTTQRNLPYFNEWTIVDTDDLCDLFSCGSEVEGSCQRIDGDPKLNKCLLGYVMDGKNRLLAIKDHSGKIVARGIFRILLDSRNKEPILFLEKIYPKEVSQDLEDALLQFAIRRSKFLGLPLVSVEVGEGITSNKAFVSIGSKVPYEYVDAGEGIHRDGKYTIMGGHYLSGE